MGSPTQAKFGDAILVLLSGAGSKYSRHSAGEYIEMKAIAKKTRQRVFAGAIFRLERRFFF